MLKRLLFLIVFLSVLSTSSSALPGGGSMRRPSRTSQKVHRVKPHSTLELRVRHVLEDKRRLWETPESPAFPNREIVRRPLITTLKVKNVDTIGVAKRLARINAINEFYNMDKSKRETSNLSGNLAQDSITLKPVVPGLMPPSHPSSGSKGVSINGGREPQVNNN